MDSRCSAGQASQPEHKELAETISHNVFGSLSARQEFIWEPCVVGPHFLTSAITASSWRNRSGRLKWFKHMLLNCTQNIAVDTWHANTRSEWWLPGHLISLAFVARSPKHKWISKMNSEQTEGRILQLVIFLCLLYVEYNCCIIYSNYLKACYL